MNHFDKPLNVLIVDDNSAFNSLLELLLRDMGIQSIHIATNYQKALEMFSENDIDLCIVDIDLGRNEKTGIDLVQAIREQSEEMPVLYLTSNYTEEFYSKSRLTRPNAFLSKEISKFKIFQAIDLAIMGNKTEPAPTKPEGQIPFFSPRNFFFKIGDVYKSIPLEEISYFYSDQKINYARVGSRNYPTTVLLRTLERELSDDFIRIHRSYLVNIKLIESIHPAESTILINEETLPIGYAYRKNFFDKIVLLK